MYGLSMVSTLNISSFTMTDFLKACMLTRTALVDVVALFITTIPMGHQRRCATYATMDEHYMFVGEMID